MKILIANLKHFYQCRRLWLFCLIILPYLLAVLFFFPYVPDAGSLYFVLISFFAGLMVADLQKSILTKPLSFCLPKHRRALGLIIILVGIVVNLMFAVRAFGFHGLEFPHILLVILAAGSVGVICYLIGAWFILLSLNLGFLAFLPFLVLPTIFLDLHKLVQDMIVTSPLLPIMLGTTACAISWNMLGRDSLARRFCGKMLLGMAESGNLKRAQKINRKMAAQRSSKRLTMILDRLDEFFISRMNACPPLSRRRYILGNIYALFGGFLEPLWVAWLLLGIVLGIGVILAFGYFLPSEAGFMLFIGPAFFVLQLDLISYRSMLLTGGRAERFYGALAAGIAETVLFSLTLAMISLISIPLAAILPEITFEGDTFVFHPIDAQHLYLCFFLMPITLTIGTLYSKKNISFVSSMAVIMIVIGAPTLIVIYWAKVEALLFPDSVLGVVGLVSSGWMIFAILVGRHCRKHSLVGQGR